jgi:hypothetical protein
MRDIHDANRIPLEERLPVKIRVGKFKGLIGRVTYVRRSTGHPRIYVQVGKNGQGSWLAPRSVEVIA